MFERVRRGVVLFCAASVVSLGLLASSGASAYGYGNSGGETQLYQATLSANCDNVSLCGADGLGGFWAWAEFGQVTSTGAMVFDGEATGCGHLVKAGAPGTAGAQHFQVGGTWEIIYFGSVPWIVITSETDLLNGGSMSGQTITIPSEFVPVGPAMKAKVDTLEGLGFTAPGVSFNVTVTPMHAA